MTPSIKNKYEEYLFLILLFPYTADKVNLKRYEGRKRISSNLFR